MMKPDISTTSDRLSPTTRLGAISFINTMPVYWPWRLKSDIGIVFKNANVDVIEAVPARLNAMVSKQTLDVSPVSSAFYLRHQSQLVLLDNLSVSSPGAVESVLFVSNRHWGKDLLNFDEIRIPDDSETSVALLAHLLEEATGEDLRPRFKLAPANDYCNTLQESGNALIIGDNALLAQKGGFPEGFHSNDLSSLWKEATGLPFVFAVWVAQKKWAEEHPEQLRAVTQLLQQSREQFFNNPSTYTKTLELAETQSALPRDILIRYYNQCLTYKLDELHLCALSHFESILAALDSRTIAPTERQREQAV